MAQCFLHGNGGANVLNFKVVGNPQPANPRENTIWINTDTPITFYAFQTEAPSNPQEGWVWIFVGTSSTAAFNALKKNGIQVYPISAKQYIGGAWVDKTAKSYQNGEWVDWVVSLYDSGKASVPFVDSSTANYGGYTSAVSDAPSRGSVVYNADHIVLSVSAGTASDSSSQFIGTQNEIDVRGHSTLYVEFDNISISKTGGDSWGNGNYVCVSASPIKQFPHTSGSFKRINATSGAQTVTIDISGFDTAYIVVYGHVFNTATTVSSKIRRIKLI